MKLPKYTKKDYDRMKSKQTGQPSLPVDVDVSHKKRHVILHKYLDELIADFINHTHKLPSETTLIELMEWSNKQQINPDE
jgi:hypothetical protein